MCSNISPGTRSSTSWVTKSGVYGYVRTQGGGPLKLERVDQEAVADSLQDVLVVWTATTLTAAVRMSSGGTRVRNFTAAACRTLTGSGPTALGDSSTLRRRWNQTAFCSRATRVCYASRERASKRRAKDNPMFGMPIVRKTQRFAMTWRSSLPVTDLERR